MAGSSAVTAWLAFNGTDRKLTRYSNTVAKVMAKLLWWKHLEPMEKVNTSINNVVQLLYQDLVGPRS